MYVDGSLVATPPSGDNRGWLARGTARRCWLARRHCGWLARGIARRCWLARRHCKTTLADTSLTQFLTCVCRHGWRSWGGAMRGMVGGHEEAQWEAARPDNPIVLGVYCGSRVRLSYGIHAGLSFIDQTVLRCHAELSCDDWAGLFCDGQTVLRFFAGLSWCGVVPLVWSKGWKVCMPISGRTGFWIWVWT
jgi:hypothetical protein